MIFPVLKIITDQNYLVNLNEKILFIDLLQFDYEKIIFISIIAVVSIYIIKSFYMIFFSYWKSYVIVRMNNDISKRLFKKYIFSPYSYFFEKNSSEFLRNIYSESRYINQAVDNSFKLLIELFSIVIILIVLFLFDFKSSFSLMLFFVTFFLIFNFISSKRFINGVLKNKHMLQKLLELYFNLLVQ